MKRSVRWGVAAATAALVAAGGLPGVAHAAAPAEADVVAVPGAEVVPDSWIVVLRPSRDAVAGKARALAGRHAATVSA